jgi:hypothetical protein
MNRIQFGEGGCEKTRKYLDAYVSNELMVETNYEVLRHIEGCPACGAEVENRTRLRSRLKAAVKAQSVPPELQVRIREQIRSGRPGSWVDLGWLRAGWPRWAGATATAAALVVAAGLWVNPPTERMPALSDRPAQNTYISRVSANLAATLKVGLGDHLHCSIFRKYPKDPPPVEKMEGELGPAYAGLLPVVRSAVPQGYKVIMAHQCSYAGRKFVHLTLEKDGGLLSLVVSRKQSGESLDGLSAAAEPSGVRIYQSGAGPYQVAGFEAGNFFAYVVSGLMNKEHLQIASSVAPGVREFLMKTPA